MAHIQVHRILEALQLKNSTVTGVKTQELQIEQFHGQGLAGVN